MAFRRRSNSSNSFVDVIEQFSSSDKLAISEGKTSIDDADAAVTAVNKFAQGGWSSRENGSDL